MTACACPGEDWPARMLVPRPGPGGLAQRQVPPGEPGIQPGVTGNWLAQQREELPEPAPPLLGERALAGQVPAHVRTFQRPPRGHQVAGRQARGDRTLRDLTDRGQRSPAVIDQRAVKAEKDQIDHRVIVERKMLEPLVLGAVNEAGDRVPVPPPAYTAGEGFGPIEMVSGEAALVPASKRQREVRAVCGPTWRRLS